MPQSNFNFLPVKSEFLPKMVKNGHFSVHVNLGGPATGAGIFGFPQPQAVQKSMRPQNAAVKVPFAGPP